MKRTLLTFGCAMAALTGAAVTVTPKATDEILVNPGMGLCHYYYSSRVWAYGAPERPGELFDATLPGMSVIYMRLPWCYLEPKEGEYRWDLIESKTRPWTAAGRKVAFRITCMDHTLCSIPQWAMDAGIRGEWFPYRHSETHSPVFEPDWDDPVLLEKYGNFLRAFARRYDGNPSVAYVDLGSFGFFGEGHSPKLNKLPRAKAEALCRLHVDLLRKCLPNTYLVVSDDVGGGGWDKEPDQEIFRYCRSLGIGLRDDSIMCSPPPHEWKSARYGRLFARETPVVLEVGHLTTIRARGNWNPANLLKCVEDYRASYLSEQGFANDYREAGGAVWNDVARRIGYRFELRRVDYPDTVTVDEPVSVSSTWVNVGVAPQYADASLTWSLLDENGTVCWSVTDPAFGFRSLEPKLDGVERPRTVETRCRFGCSPAVPDNGNDAILNWCVAHGRNDPGRTVDLLKPGTYTLAVSVGRADGEPQIALPLASGAGRVYPVGRMTVRARETRRFDLSEGKGMRIIQTNERKN